MMLPAGAVDEAKAYLRIVGADEDALVARLMRSAGELCERFTGQMLVARSFTQMLPAGGAWMRLGATPVLAISVVEAVPALGAAAVLLAPGDYSIDIDANGDGWVRAQVPGNARRVRVTFEAGMAAAWTELPEALRQGIIRLAAHGYTQRDKAEDTAPPAAVTALWRPWRRMRLA